MRKISVNFVIFKKQLKMAASTKIQFDSTLGGDIVLPQTLNVMEFISSRSQEIAALSEAIDHPQRTSLISQRLPKHMQRRIMSHNAKRLPRALRQALIQIREKSGNPNEVKRPRRKYRRRPHNLLSEYNRRQRTFVWLETHIWHAKRFHLINKWGYRLPDYPNDKSYRACYRASTQHCLLQDVSYYICIELSGEQDNIINGINKLTSPQCGLTFGAKYFLNGSREGSTIIYHQGQYPYGVIGVVNFLWRPQSVDMKNGKISLINKRTMWIWAHPAYYNEFFNEVIDIFHLVKADDDDDNNMKMEIGDIKKNENFCDNMEKNSAEKISRYKNRTTKYISNLHQDLSVIELKDTINRFRLTGPLSQPILTNAFVLLDPGNNVTLSQSKFATNNLSSDDWIRHYYSSEEKINSLKTKCELWLKFKNITDPRQLPNGMVLPLVIQDPRFNLPDKRTKAVTDTKEIEEQFIVDMPDIELLNDNPFWDHTIRNKVTDNKLSTSDLSQLQSKQLVPSSIKDIVKDFDVRHYLPVILIRNSSYSSTFDCKQKGVCSGWDIILPSGWAMPVWLSLVWRGARVGGLRESCSLRRESGILPPIFPDSKCGPIEDEIEKQILTETYFKKPPAKRPNFKKLGIVAPFSYPWKELLKDWNDLDSLPSSFFVIRDRIRLNKINVLVNKLNFSKTNCENDRCDVKNYLDINDGDIKNALIGINVKVHGRGTINEHSTVCLPLKEDLDLLIHNKKKIVNVRPTELSHDDSNRAERVDLRKNHLKFLKRMKKKRKKFKSNNDKDNYELFRKLTKESIEEKDSKMKELWLPDLNNINIKDSSNRKIIGYVVAGDYSFLSSCSSGQSYIVLTALFELFRSQSDLQNNKFFVLIRAPSSPQYSFASISLANSSLL